MIAAAALTLAGCGSGDSTEGGAERYWAGSIEERDGVVHVTNPRDALWQDRDPAPLRFDLEQTFGIETAPEDEIIGGIGMRGVTVDGVGNVYVFDDRADQLLSFAPDGSLRWRAGRAGQGPGEFDETDLSLNHWFISMLVTGGEISVGDIDSYELHFFDRTGAPIRVIARDFDRMVGQVVSGDTPVMYSFLEPAVRLPSGHWLASPLWYEADDPQADLRRRLADGTLRDRPLRSSVDLFDPDGRFLYTDEFEGAPPPIGSLHTVGPDGKLYTTLLDPFPQVRRYRVIIDDA